MIETCLLYIECRSCVFMTAFESEAVDGNCETLTLLASMAAHIGYSMQLNAADEYQKKPSLLQWRRTPATVRR